MREEEGWRGRRAEEKACANVCTEARRNRTRTETRRRGTTSGSRDLVANVGTGCEAKGTTTATRGERAEGCNAEEVSVRSSLSVEFQIEKKKKRRKIVNSKETICPKIPIPRPSSSKILKGGTKAEVERADIHIYRQVPCSCGRIRRPRVARRRKGRGEKKGTETKRDNEGTRGESRSAIRSIVDAMIARRAKPTQPHPWRGNGDEPTHRCTTFGSFTPAAHSRPLSVPNVVNGIVSFTVRYIHLLSSPERDPTAPPAQPRARFTPPRGAGYVPPSTPRALRELVQTNRETGQRLAPFPPPPSLSLSLSPEDHLLAPPPPSSRLAPRLFLRLCVRRALRPIPVLGYVVLRIPDSALSSTLLLPFPLHSRPFLALASLPPELPSRAGSFGPSSSSSSILLPHLLPLFLPPPRR